MATTVAWQDKSRLKVPRGKTVPLAIPGLAQADYPQPRSKLRHDVLCSCKV